MYALGRIVRVMLFVLLAIAILAALCLGAALLVGYVQSQQLVVSSSPASLEIQAPVGKSADNGEVFTQTATVSNTVVLTECVSISEFQKMWEKTTDSEGPGPLMELLNVEWEAEMPGNEIHCMESAVGDWVVPPGSFVWSDRLNQLVTTTDGSNLDSGDFVDLRCQGTWCVSFAYDWLIWPTPGRSANAERFLDPSKDLSDWSK